MGRFDKALEDADRCILVKPEWHKAYFRKGTALRGLYRHAEASAAFQQGLAIAPNDPGLKSALEAAGTAATRAVEGLDDLTNNELHDACKHGDMDIARQCTTEDPKAVSQTDNKGNTPLHYAAWEVRANPAVWARGLCQGALQGAAGAQDHTEIVKMLTDVEGIDLNAANILGQTPLHLAAWWGRKEVVEWLMAQSGIDLNALDKGGETPLHHAARNSRDAICGLLCDGGAGTLIKSHNHQTAYDIADDCCPLATCRHDECAELIQTRMLAEAEEEEKNKPKGLDAFPVGTVVTVNGLMSETHKQVGSRCHELCDPWIHAVQYGGAGAATWL